MKILLTLLTPVSGANSLRKEGVSYGGGVCGADSRFTIKVPCPPVGDHSLPGDRHILDSITLPLWSPLVTLPLAHHI